MAGYESRQVDGATEFSAKPEIVPAPLVMIAIPGALLVLIAFSMGFVYGLIAVGFCYGAMYFLMRPVADDGVPAT